MGLPDITHDLFTSFEQLFCPFINLKSVNLIDANIPYDTLYHRTCFYSSWCQLPLNISCSSLKVESRTYQLQAMSKSIIIPWIFKASYLFSFLLGQQALHTLSPLLLELLTDQDAVQSILSLLYAQYTLYGKYSIEIWNTIVLNELLVIGDVILKL